MAERQHDKCTVFVRGVSFDADDDDFSEFFSDIGPVKQAFLVKRKGAAKHKGFGFVHFALHEDAERAAAELNGKELKGRKLQVEVALKRAPLEERKQKRKQQLAEEADAAAGAAEGGAGAAPEPEEAPAPPAKKARAPKPAPAPAPPPASVPAAAGAAERQARGGAGSQEKHRLLRAVAVGRLTPETVNAAIELARAAGEVEEVVNPAPQAVVGQYKLERDGCSGHAFLAMYASVKQAVAAVARLHGQPVASGGEGEGGGKQGKKKGKKQKGGAGQQEAEGGAGAGVVLWARQVSGEGLHLKRWRLIVRNLPFNVTEADLRASFAPAGFLWELTLPRSADGKARGFAFVGYTCRAHAEKGIRLVNGRPVAGRPVAVDWAVAKAQFDAAGKQAGGGAEGRAQDTRQPEELAGLDSDSEGEGRPPPAARRKLGHESDEEAAQDLEPEQERDMLHSVIDDILGGGAAGTAGKAGKAGKAAPAGDSDGEGGSGSDSEEEEGWSSEEEVASSGGEEEGHSGDMFSRRALQQRTTAQQAALDRLDRKLQAKPLGKATAAAAGGEEGGEGSQQGEKRPREAVEGATVFVRGLPLDVTKQQLQTKMQGFGRVASCRLVVDKASGRLKGTAFVDFAEAEAAQKAAEACAKARRKEGPGVVVAGRAVDVDLALGQEAVRSLAVQKAGERGPKDRRNMYLAKEGLIAEGTPAWQDMSVNDRNKRKRAAADKKTKLASPNFLVSNTRLSVRNIPHTWTEKQLKQLFTEAVVERASKARPRVRQVKILLDEDAPGGPKSKGIGFVEFEDHEHALCALRQLNNNPKPWGKERRPIIEFAIENAKILKAREAKLARSKQQQGAQQAQQGAQRQQEGTDGGAQPAEGGRPAKRAKQQAGSAERAAEGGADDGGDGAAGEGDMAGEGQPPQQSKRQRRREIRQKLKAVKQQKLQEAAAAAAAAKQAGPGGGAGSGPAAAATEAGHSRAKKRRELRKAKKGGAAGGAAAPAGAVAGVVKVPAAKPSQAPPQQQQQKQQQQPKGPGKQARQQQQQQQQQRGKPPAKAGARQAQQPGRGKPAGQAAAGRAGGANSRAIKGVQQAQREQQAQQRKRRADDVLDGLVAGHTGGPKQQKRQKGGGPDKLERLAAEYRKKYFDAPSSAGKRAQASKPGAQRPAAGLKRWFE